jgi:hypothetical protein
LICRIAASYSGAKAVLAAGKIELTIPTIVALLSPDAQKQGATMSSDSHLPPTREEAIDQALLLNKSLRDSLLYFSVRHQRIEKAILFLTVLTTGALWTLLALRFEAAATWVGAVISTVVTFLSLYQLNLGPKKTTETAVRLQNEADELLIQTRSSSSFDSEKTQRRIKGTRGEAIREVLMKKPRNEWTPADHQLFEQSHEQ